MKLFIITGLSGAGKSQALRAVEDMGYYCVDNLPISLLERFLEVAKEANIPKVAIVLDIRNYIYFQEIEEVFSPLEKNGQNFKVIFLEADQRTLIGRYKELRRPHPLGDTLSKGIQQEKKIMKPIRDQADYIITTTKLSSHQLKKKMQQIIEEKEREFSLTIMSFGFKNGMLEEADMVFDIRFLKNPYYDKNLKHLNGLTEEVREFVLSSQPSKVFLNKVEDLIEFLIPNYLEEGKDSLTIGFGCTGGFHRSVAMAEEMGAIFTAKGHSVMVDHRDLKE